jgi:hypothetical protein
MSEAAADIPEGNDRRLNRMVAVTVVMLSVMMAVGKIKDDNIVQAMQAAQADKIDLWNEYQATRIKAHGEHDTADLLSQFNSAEARTAHDKAVQSAMRHEKESIDLKKKAEDATGEFDKQGYRDDQFDLSDGFFSIALAVAAIAALVESLPLLGVAWGSAAFGLLFLVAGFAQLPIHPDKLVAFLS